MSYADRIAARRAQAPEVYARHAAAEVDRIAREKTAYAGVLARAREIKAEGRGPGSKRPIAKFGDIPAFREALTRVVGGAK